MYIESVFLAIAHLENAIELLENSDMLDEEVVMVRGKLIATIQNLEDITE